MYHLMISLVCLAKYRRVVYLETIENKLKAVNIEISKRYQIHFFEIVTDYDYVHFLVLSVLKYNPIRILMILKSIKTR
jgi:putative transposase